MCGVPEAALGERVQVHHLDGREANFDRRNLLRACRSCNQLADRVLKAHGLGVKTQQFNPRAQGARNLREWLMAVMTVTGQAPQMDLQKAIDLIRATPPEDRSGFASEIWRRRRARRPTAGHGG
ncbi:MAG: hypothetical protein FJ272_20245 [Planctomycetes bacterium]|nr:hypothetical protein [Planctomycetota bacterium]